jgi:hypothetical protein
VAAAVAACDRLARGRRQSARGFVGDLQIDDWLVAEREVDAMAASGEPPAPQPPQPLGIEQNPRTNHGPSKARRA